VNATEAASSDLATSEAVEAQLDTTGETLSGETGSEETVAVEESPIEIWRPHRQQPHRRPEARSRKKPFVRRGAPTGVPAATNPEMAATAAPQVETVAGELPGIAGTGKEAGEGQQQGGSPPTAFKDRHRRGSERGGSEQRQRSNQRRPGQAAEQNRSRPEERKTGRGERFDVREKRPSERPPDPNSPFAKLLVLKARMEEQTRPEKDKQDS
jgi:ATP-dependent RNA helicase SUPV3L1/SUV3